LNYSIKREKEKERIEKKIEKILAKPILYKSPKHSKIY